MRNGVWSFALAACLAWPARGQASSGGDFTLDAALVDSAGGGESAGGGFWTNGTVGQAAALSSGGAWGLRRGFFDPPRFSLQNPIPQFAQDPSGAAALSLPAFAVASPTFDVVYRSDPGSNPLAVDPAIIARANQKMLAAGGALACVLPGDVWEIHTMDETGLGGGPLAGPGTLSFKYLDADGDGAVDGTNPPVRAKTLKLWMLDEAAAQWVKVPGSAVDTAKKTISAPVSHLSVYAFIGGADAAVADVYAYPVPWRPFGPNAGEGPGQTGSEAAGITFANLPSDGTIDIYTPAGNLVRHIDIPLYLAPAKLSWDVRNSQGAAVASGVYLWRVASGGNAKIGRLMIIR